MKKIIILLLLNILVYNISTSQWINGNYTGGTNYSLNEFGNNIYCGSSDGVYMSSNSGVNWVSKNVGLSGGQFYSVIQYFNKLYTCSSGGVFCSNDSGNTWNNVNNGLIQGSIIKLHVYHNKLYAAAGYGYFTTDDTNYNWIRKTALINEIIQDFTSNDSLLFAGTVSNGVFASSNEGQSWFPASNGITSSLIYALASTNRRIFAATQKGIFVSTNNGLNWDSSYSGFKGTTLSIYLKDSILYAGNIRGVYISTNWGETWFQKNQGISPVQYFFCFHAMNNYIYGGGQYGFVWKRLISEIIGINNLSNEIPVHYKLYQNYPNPFNPETSIKFEIINSDSPVRLSIFDITGKEVSILINQAMKPGTYEYKYNAEKLNSGIYFYVLKAGSYIETRKMMLIK